MIAMQSLTTFIGVLIGIFFTSLGIQSIVAMFINKDQSLGRISFWSSIFAFGVTLTIAILKPL